MFDGPLIRHPLVFEHVFDQINPPPGAIEFIAENLIGRAGGGAKPAMDTGAQDLIGARGAGIFELVGGEGRLHVRPQPNLASSRG